MQTGIIVFAHGSRIESANEAVRTVAAELARTGPATRVEAAFLELGQPDLPTAASRLAEQGVERLVIVPYFLTLGLHMERDLPRIVERISGWPSRLATDPSRPCPRGAFVTQFN